MQINVNNKLIEINKTDLDKPLIEFLREDLDLTGTKNGCNIGVCGACTVLANNKPIKACKKKLADVIDYDILTIEGMSDEHGKIHPLQQAFLDHGAVQCGFCIPAMILTAHAFLLQNNKPTREQIRKAINPNLCRCTGYQQIVDAIEDASKFYS